MPLSIPRGAKGTPDGMVNENRPWGPHPGHNVQGGSDHQRRNRGMFEDMSDETDGLVTKRSIRNQQGYVHSHLDQFPGNRWCQFGLDFLMAAHSPQKGNMDRRYTADDPLCGDGRQG